jgi:hypothetical protein
MYTISQLPLPSRLFYIGCDNQLLNTPWLCLSSSRAAFFGAIHPTNQNLMQDQTQESDNPDRIYQGRGCLFMSLRKVGCIDVPDWLILLRNIPNMMVAKRTFLGKRKLTCLIPTQIRLSYTNPMQSLGC